MKIGPSENFMKKFELNSPKGSKKFKPTKPKGAASRLTSALKNLKKM